MKVAVFDIETSTIPALVKDVSKLYCICIKINDNEVVDYSSISEHSLDEALKKLNSADLIVGHNIAKFDIPLIEKFLGRITTPFIDTLIDAKLVYSKDTLKDLDLKFNKDLPRDLIGSYSLKAFGYRFKLNKIEYKDFTKLSKEMIEYCKRDVELTYTLYKHLINQPNYPSEFVRKCEYRVASIIYNQEMSGFMFDISKAKALAMKLQFKAMNLEHRLRSIFKPKFGPNGEVINPKRNATYKLIKELPRDNLVNLREFEIPLQIDKYGRYKNFRAYKWLDKPYKIIKSKVTIGAPYQNIKLTSFNPNSRTQIAKRLMSEFNFKPIIFTEKGNVVINEFSLDGVLNEENQDE